MAKKLIAKTIIGKEYMHSRHDAYFVLANAAKIAEKLNASKYQLNDGEKWHVYDYDFGQEYYVERRIWLTNRGGVKSAYL